jgi:hypothetical protein
MSRLAWSIVPPIKPSAVGRPSPRDVLAEESELFGERASAGDEFSPPVTDQVEGGETPCTPGPDPERSTPSPSS